jgi:putative MATE family efflux protein
MKDLTKGPIPQHMVALAVPMAAGMLLQTLYFFVDLYFVARLGEAAIAGVGAAGNLMFVAFFLSQMLGVGTVAMVSHAVGRKDRQAANHAFNQATAIAAVFTVLTVAGGYAIAGPYARFLGADAATREAAETFLHWYIPNLALQFPIVLMSAGLRGTGIVKPATVVQALTVVLNAILAPIFIAGWGTGVALGVAGAGLASSISAAIGVVVLAVYFVRLEHYIGFELREWKPDWAAWRRLLNIGLPAGGEFALFAIFAGIIYWAARDLGTDAQAGVALGFRINQMLFVPALAIAFAATPIGGQNFGARDAARVRETFRVCLAYLGSVMVALLVFIQWAAEPFARIFTADAGVVASAVLVLTYLSWNFIPSSVTMSCTSMFQSMGNTWPSFASTALRIVSFAIPAVWIARQPWFELRHILILSVATVFLQAAVSYLWLRREFALRLTFSAPGSPRSRP